MKISKDNQGNLVLTLDKDSPADMCWQAATLKAVTDLSDGYQSLKAFKPQLLAYGFTYYEAGQAPIACWGGPAIMSKDGNAYGFMRYEFELECQTLAQQGFVVFKLAS